MLLQMAEFHSFYAWVVFQYTHTHTHTHTFMHHISFIHSSLWTIFIFLKEVKFKSFNKYLLIPKSCSSLWNCQCCCAVCFNLTLKWQRNKRRPPEAAQVVLSRDLLHLGQGLNKELKNFLNPGRIPKNFLKSLESFLRPMALDCQVFISLCTCYRAW